jgi:hypothetical protein
MQIKPYISNHKYSGAKVWYKVVDANGKILATGFCRRELAEAWIKRERKL